MTLKTLKKFWGYDSFRPLQEEIIESLLAGKDTLGILPTGGGKSVTFQVPGLIREGLTIVVTPLISLMKDQVDNLRKRRIQAVYLHSGMTLRERTLARERLFNNKAKFLYISPERLGSEAFLREIRSLKVSFIVVDEAHCISQWGYDFRPSYLKIKQLRKVFPEAPVLALTASATKAVEKDICLRLEFKDPGEVFRASISRDNLTYVVRNSEGKLYDIEKILAGVPGTAIIYVRSRKRTREIAEYLINSGVEASYYHAGIDPLLKEERQTKWKEGEIRVMVATNAFGMGIDKEDVRTVIHYDMPPSLEEYYQEAGRAGRDGKQAYAVLLVAKNDKATLRRRLTMEFPEKDIIRRIYTRLCVFSHLEIGEGYDKTVEFDLAKFCATYRMEEAVVRPALRILSQAGYADFIEEYENSSRIMVTVERDELYKVKLASPIHEQLLTAILRNYPGLFTDYVFINEKRLSLITGIDTQEIYTKLVEMSKIKVIHYIPRRKTPMLYFPTSMEEERFVMIGKAVYEDRKSILKARIDAMIDYGFSEGECRLAKMMAYFGEDEIKPCGHCDSCRNSARKPAPDIRTFEDSLEALLRANPDGLEVTQLKYHFGKHYSEAMNILRNLCREEIVSFEGNRWRLNN